MLGFKLKMILGLGFVVQIQGFTDLGFTVDGIQFTVKIELSLGDIIQIQVFRV